MELEMQEVILVEEQAHNMDPLDGQDLSAELEETCARMDVINGMCAAEGGRPSQLVVGRLPIQDISQLPNSSREVLMAAGLILEHLREAQASGIGPLD
jgi:hypothetical protein